MGACEAKHEIMIELFTRKVVIILDHLLDSTFKLDQHKKFDPKANDYYSY